MREDKLYNARQNACECIVDWDVRVRSLAANCGYKTELNIFMTDVFIMGLHHEPILNRLFEENAADSSWNKIVELAMAKEAAMRDRPSTSSTTEEIKYHRQEKPKEKCSVCGRKIHTSEKCFSKITSVINVVKRAIRLLFVKVINIRNKEM